MLGYTHYHTHALQAASLLMTSPPSQTVFSAQPDIKSLSTPQLLALAQADQWLALQELVHRYQKPVFITLFLLLPASQSATALTQEVLLLMCRNIKSVTDPNRFKFWLNQLLLTQLQEANPHTVQTTDLSPATAMYAAVLPPVLPPVLPTNNPVALALTPHSPPLGLPDSRHGNPIYQAILALPQTERLLLVLREVQGLAYEDIASLTAMPLAKVQHGLAQARLHCQAVVPPNPSEGLTP
jgi:RNA polymerase sigma-70 factor, ECF subfamily